ncbi:MAG: hypothetical protein IKN28_00535, partial [Firmicutes bacterium]|nr:hypothetical protein [Bacillota bacterium]
EKKRCRAQLKRACAQLLTDCGLAEAPVRYSGVLDETVRETFREYFVRFTPGKTGTVKASGIRSYMERITEKGVLSDRMIRAILFNGNPADNYLLHLIAREDPQIDRSLRLLRRVHDKAGLNTKALIKEHTAGYQAFMEDHAYQIGRSFTEKTIANLLAKNPQLKRGAEQYQREERSRNKVKSGLLDAMPETYPDLFPLARQKKRHFILHIGPTNSGKSYDALNALKEAESGIYLAPLRLLAYEKFEELNEAGCPCSLKTGEEEIGIPFSRVQSSTIEVLNFETEYDLAVIDEAQMITDSQRGSAWTFALLGVRADLVHVCLAPEAETVVKNVIAACGDSYEVVRHERLVPLVFDERVSSDFTKEARRGTAFIVFSRKDVHAVAGELQRKGHRCSVIYGALPYDVRRNEVKRYVNGETDVVVATDAIGMGLNLPIERVIFLTTEKFDGTQQRSLTPTEIKQIAGRAGRYGMFDKGYAGSIEERKMVRKAIFSDIPQIREARIGFPYSLTGIDGTISQLMSKWGEIEPKSGFEHADLSIEIGLAEELERETNDKELVYRFVMIPFDEKNEELKALWLSLFRDEKSSRVGRYMDYLPPKPDEQMPLDVLEVQFKACDMLYHYIEAFTAGHTEDLRAVLMRKNEISARIMELLSRQRLSMKKCRICGKELPFRHKFGVCEECFARAEGRIRPQRNPRRRR